MKIAIVAPGSPEEKVARRTLTYYGPYDDCQGYTDFGDQRSWDIYQERLRKEQECKSG